MREVLLIGGCAFFIVEVVRTFRKMQVMSIQIILSGSLLLFLILPAFLQPGTNSLPLGYFTLLMLALGGSIVASRLIPYDIYRGYKQKLVVRENWLKFGALLYCLYLFYEVYSVMSSGMSFFEVLLANRLQFEERVATNTGNLLGRLILPIRYLFYIYIYQKFFKRGKHILFIGLYLLPMIHLLLTAITRFDFLVLLMILAILYIKPYIFSKNGVRYARLVIVMVPAFLLVSTYMYVANTMRHGLLSNESVNLSEVINSDITKDSPYFDLLGDLYMAKTENRISFEYGLGWVVYPIISLVPRRIWLSKPSTSFSNRYTEKLYWDTGEGPVATFTIFGEGYLQCGYVGVILAPIFFSRMRYFTLRLFAEIQNSEIILYILMFSMITFFRAELPTVFVLIDIISAVFIRGLLSIRQ